MNYFNIYKLVISTIAEDRPSDTDELLEIISMKPEFLGLDYSGDEDEVTIFVLNTFKNLVEDGLINARHIPIDGAFLYEIDHLTTQGFIYLETLRKPSAFEKIKEHAIKEGLAPSPQNLSKLLAKIAWG